MLCLFLIPLLASCARTETRFVQVPPVPIPVELTADCPVPEIPDPLTWGSSLELNERLLTVLGNCNKDKASIRKIELSRQGKTQ
ncbi:Rz1-like lysis system protein LysC [Pantoea stewartii]|uniref:Rz1-like lysis system protein LysC n=1 Tax=Pantoea stewartii TaxID=66269 RepID=UPI0011309957|nr:peptidase [Pantoea stewartii subsp. stewartii]